jgi:hypothetical protein
MFPINRSLIKAAAAFTLLGATVPVGIGFAHGSDHDGLTSAQRTVIREATDKFRDVDTAIAAGYVPTDVCAELPDGGGGMGYHFVNPALAADAKVDPTTPEILVYLRAKDGRFRLGAIEYFVADSDQDLATDADRSTLMGHAFDGRWKVTSPGCRRTTTSTPGCTAPTPLATQCLEPWGQLRLTCQTQ